MVNEQQANKRPSDNYVTEVEEPFIEGDEPKSAKELAADSQPDANTVDDGILATDPSDEGTQSGGWDFEGHP